MSKNYKIKTNFWLIKDEAGVKSHIKSGDYFGTIATILNLLKEEIKKEYHPRTKILEKTLRDLEKDFVFLQNNYQIKSKLNPKSKTKI